MHFRTVEYMRRKKVGDKVKDSGRWGVRQWKQKTLITNASSHVLPSMSSSSERTLHPMGPSLLSQVSTCPGSLALPIHNESSHSLDRCTSNRNIIWHHSAACKRKIDQKSFSPKKKPVIVISQSNGCACTHKPWTRPTSKKTNVNN